MAIVKSKGHTLALVADADQRALATFDLDERRQVAVTPLGVTPSQLLVLADGRVAVTLQDANRVAVFEITAIARPLELRCSARVPSEPFGLAATGDTLLVTSSWDRQLSALDPDSLDTKYRVALEREPRAVLALGDRAFVSHAVGSRVSVVDLAGDLHQARRISLDTDGNFSTRKLTQGFALALARLGEGKRLFAPGAAAFSGNPVISHGYGSLRVRAHLPLVSVIDPAAETSLTRFAHEGAASPDHWDHVGGWGEECTLPRAATSARDKLYVACQGTNTLLELDARASDPIRVESRRFPLPAGPSGVALAGTRAAVWSQFAGELALVDLGRSGREAVTRITSWRAPEARYTAEQLRGRELFHNTFDLRFSLDGRTCASCHPDGRDDGLTWSTPDGPRQSIMLAGRIQGTAPLGWFGDHRDLDHHLELTFRALGGRGLNAPESKQDLAALKAWLAVMPAPHRTETDRGSAKYQRGAALFFSEETGCARCHVAGGSDNQRHDVKSGRPVESHFEFDTPSLSFVGGTAPYFHDGRYPTLQILLRATDTQMGHSAQLDREDIEALSAFLQSLDGAPAVKFKPSSVANWTQESHALAMPPPRKLGRRSLARLQRDVHPPQLPVKSESLDLEALPLFEVGPEDKRYPRPLTRPSAVEADDLVLSFTNFKRREDALARGGDDVRLAVKDAAFGWIQESLDRQPVRADLRGGVMAHCSPSYEFYSGVAWKTLKLDPDGNIQLDAATGWLSRRECRVWVTSRVRATAKAIIPGLLYGFRTRCKGCSTDQLHLLTPDDNWGNDAFAEHTLAIERSTSQNLDLAIGRDKMRRWRKLGVVTDYKRPTFGVQLSWAASEPKPIAIYFVAERER
ncbi:MAG: c-type cytochrome [Polyangiaceae bacterium]|nr:c-type cytochrome [Polyangiaceae bacterium]